MGLGAKLKYGEAIDSAKFQRDNSQIANSPRAVVNLMRAMSLFPDLTILFGRRPTENNLLNEWFVQLDDCARAGEYLSETTTETAGEFARENQKRADDLKIAYEALADLSQNDVRTIDSLRRCYAWVEKKVGNGAKFGVQDQRGTGRVVICSYNDYVAHADHPSTAHAILKQIVSQEIETAKRRVDAGSWLVANETKSVQLRQLRRKKPSDESHRAKRRSTRRPADLDE
jgi:hypothetical protein